MKVFYLVLAILLALTTFACSQQTAATPQSSTPAAAPPAASPALVKDPLAAQADAFQQKLRELAGSGATDCGRLQSTTADPSKLAECALAAAKSKHAFTVAYDMPGLTVGVAGNAEGKLFSLSRGGEAGSAQANGADVKVVPCPAALRVALSGRVTCFPSGASSGANPHAGGANPHGGGASPHGGMPMPPPGTPNPHAGTAPKQM